VEVVGGDDFELGPSDDISMFAVFPSHPDKGATPACLRAACARVRLLSSGECYCRCCHQPRSLFISSALARVVLILCLYLVADYLASVSCSPFVFAVMPAGSVVTALITVVNNGRTAVMVDRMEGSIRYVAWPIDVLLAGAGWSMEVLRG